MRRPASHSISSAPVDPTDLHQARPSSLGPHGPAERDPAYFIARVEESLARRLAGPGLLEILGRRLLLAGGKRARPLLVYQFGQITHASEEDLVAAATAVELIHCASLVHDDVVDLAATRRDAPTINASLGNATAVVAGDLLLCRALSCLFAYPAELPGVITVVEQMSRAAYVELRARRDAHFSLESWRLVAEGKTAALFGLGGRLAAAFAGDTRRAARFDAVARHLGVAFQIADDLADLQPGADDPLKDLREGNPSFPVQLAASIDRSVLEKLEKLYALQALNGQWTGPQLDEVAKVAQAIQDSGAFEQAAQTAVLEVETAHRLLDEDAAHPAAAAVLDWARQLTTLKFQRTPGLGS
jgi:geranylgeranyl pyrophosphate synthase